MKMQDIAIIKREVDVILIPDGHKINLLPGTEVLITQALGNSFTLSVNGNLVRLSGQNADAIGKEPMALPSEKMIEKRQKITEKLLLEQLKTCYDPEIPVNIVDLGLIYETTLTQQQDGGYHVGVVMTLTAPGCGMGPVLQQDVEDRLNLIPGVEAVDVMLVFDPPWNSDMMTDSAKLELGIL